MKRMIACAAALGLVACGPTDFGQEVQAVTYAKETISNQMRDPSSVMFRNLTYIGVSGEVCGQYNAKNGFGAYTGYQSFCVGTPYPWTEAERAAWDAEQERINKLERESTARLAEMNAAVAAAEAAAAE